MTESVKPTENAPTMTVPRSMAEVSQACARIDELIERRANAQSIVDASKAEIELLQQGIAGFVKRRRRWWLRRWGKKVPVPGGAMITHTRADKSLVLPDRDEAAIVQRLLDSRGGKRWLNVKYSLNKKALANASPSTLARLDLQVAQHDVFSLKTAQMTKPTPILRLPYRLRARRPS